MCGIETLGECLCFPGMIADFPDALLLGQLSYGKGAVYSRHAA